MGCTDAEYIERLIEEEKEAFLEALYADFRCIHGDGKQRCKDNPCDDCEWQRG